jgi:hypothetical protein
MATQGQNGFDREDALGCDLLWPDDLDAAHRLESGISLLRHDIWHRWLCPAGRLLDDPEYGFGLLAELLNWPLSPRDIMIFPRRLEAEAAKDPRVLTITVTLTQTGANAFEIKARGTSKVGPFDLRAEITDAYQRILEAA